MGVNYAPNVVRNGLVLYLDAANTKSYPGSGTTWTDLSGTGNTGTLTNGPTFSSSNNGAIVFDGSNDVAIVEGNPASLQITVGSAMAWFKTSAPGSSFRGIFTKQYAWGLFLNDSILVTYDWGGNASRSTGLSLADNTWKFVALTFSETTGTPSSNARVYLNGSLVLTTTVKHFGHNVNFELARGGPSIQQLNGTISSSMVYNRVLSASEVLQNFNATRSRYGV